jgi:hypothetical protein
MTNTYTNATKRNPINDTWGFTVSAYSSIPLKVPFKYVKQPKVLVSNKGYQMIITTNIHMKKTGRQLGGNIDKCTAGSVH